jgi:hypothetical protein
MNSSDQELRVRIREILTRHLGLERERCSPVQEKLLNLINQEKFHWHLQHQLRNQDKELRDLQLEELAKRLTGQFYRVSLVQLLALAMAVLLLAG